MAARRVPYRRRRADFFGRSSGAPNFGKIVGGGGVARRRTALSCLRTGKLQKTPRDGVLGRRPRLPQAGSIYGTSNLVRLWKTCSRR